MDDKILKPQTKSQLLSGKNVTKLENIEFTSQDDVTPPVTLKQIENLFKKSLKNISDHITNSFTKEIRELGQRMSELEIRVDDMENYTLNYSKETENLKEQNAVLQTRLEDYEIRARCSNLRIRGIPETVTDLQATMIELFQELQPAISVERLEMDRVHRALTP